MDHPQKLMPLPRGAGKALASVSILGFLLSLVLPALFPEAENLWGVPLALVVLVWSIPLMFALLRGEPWAFVLALAALVFITDSSFRARSWADKSVDAQVLARGAIWLGCGAIGALKVYSNRKMFSHGTVLCTAGLIGMFGLSALWSPTPSYTLQSAVAYSWMFLFGLAAAAVLSEKQFLLAMLIGCGLIVLPSLAIAPFADGFAPPSPGSTGEVGRLRGLTDHPIPLAETATLFTFACVFLRAMLTGWGVRMILGLAAMAGLLTAALTLSRLPPLAMLTACLLFFAYRKGGGVLLVPTLIVCGGTALTMESVAGFANLLPTDVVEIFARSGSSSEILSMSGRLEIWNYVLDLVGEAPLLGHGHASGMVVLKDFVGWKITHAHNLYLQALLYGGVVGAVLLSGIIITQLRVFMLDPRPVRDILFLYLLLKGITEQSILSNMPSGTVALWMVTVGMTALTRGQGALPLAGVSGVAPLTRA